MSLLHETYVADFSSSGTITAINGTVQIAFEGRQSGAAVISGTWTGTLLVEGTCDNGTTWGTVWTSVVNQSPVALGIPTPVNSITANGVYKFFQSSGFTHYRVRASSVITGTVNVTLSVVNAPASFIYTNSAITQVVVADSNNSSTTNLGEYQASANTDTFTGTATSTLGIVGIQVSLKTDQNCTIYVDQSPDGTNWDISDSFNYYASVNNFGTTVQAINSYVRVRVTNLGSSSTTYFRLQTCLCPIIEPLPRSLDENQNLKVAIKSNQDQYGFKVENTPIDEMRVITPFRLVGTVFSGSVLDTNFWTSSLGVGGTATVGDGQLILATGTTVNNNTSIQSVRVARYIGGSSNRFRAIIRIPNVTTANNILRWGAFDSTDGCFFELNSTTFKIVTRKSGHDTVISSGSFNGTLGSTYTLDTNVKTYEIYWTNSKVWFIIGGQLLHTVSATTCTWTSNIHLPIRVENNNSNGITANIGINVRAMTISRLGQDATLGIYKYISTNTTTICKYGPGTLHSVINNDNSGAIVIYDNIAGSGNIIASIDCTKVLGSIRFDVPFFTGLTIVSTLSPKITVTYE